MRILNASQLLNLDVDIYAIMKSALFTELEFGVEVPSNLFFRNAMQK